MPTEDFISCDFPDLDSFIKQLDLMNASVNKALRSAMYTGADMIKNEQKRLISGKSQRLADAINKSGIEVTKGGSLKVTSGYQKEAFRDNGGFPGVVGMTYEFGRPGQSGARKGTTMKQKRGGKIITVKKGAIQPMPHIQRGFDNMKGQAAKTMIEAYNREIDKLGDK